MRLYQIFVSFCSNREVSCAKALGINFDGGPSKLKGGSGDGAVAMLVSVSEKAVRLTGFKFTAPIHRVEEFSEEAEVDHESELTTADDDAEIDERINEADDDEDMFVGGEKTTSEKYNSSITLQKASDYPAKV